MKWLPLDDQPFETAPAIPFTGYGLYVHEAMMSTIQSEYPNLEVGGRIPLGSSLVLSQVDFGMAELLHAYRVRVPGAKWCPVFVGTGSPLLEPRGPSFTRLISITPGFTSLPHRKMPLTYDDLWNGAITAAVYSVAVSQLEERRQIRWSLGNQGVNWFPKVSRYTKSFYLIDEGFGLLDETTQIDWELQEMKFHSLDESRI